MRVSLKRTDTFTPEWNGNQELPEEEQVRFHHKFLGSADRKKYIYTKPIKFSQGDDPSKQISDLEVVTDGRGIAMKTVTSIENLEVEIVDGTVAKIDDVEVFYRYSLNDLAAELERYMLECTAVVDSGN